jgi:transcriptional regulator with XRE-family HTH domain
MEVRMYRDENVIGQNIAKFRYQRGWTQDELVGKLQLLGRYMTRDILANIETKRCVVTDKQIEYFAEVFGVKAGDFFPEKRRLGGRTLGLDVKIVTRRRRRHRRPRTRAPLAQPTGRK